MTEVVTVGVDAHTQVHVAAAVDGQGRVIGQLESGTNRTELARLLAWAKLSRLHGG